MNRPGTVRQANVPFSKAVKLFTTVKLAGLKESAKAYSGAVYGDTLYRADKNVIAMSAIILDFDNDVRNKNGTKQCTRNPTYPEDLAGPLNGMCYFFHSTWSNSVDWPKWRVIIPLDRCVDRGQWRSVVDGILWQIGDCSYNIDKSCFEPSRHFLAPSCSSTNESVAFSGYSDGQEVTHVR